MPPSYDEKIPADHLVRVYAYAEKIYSSRRIAKALRENIYFMWISGESTPDFRTINDFRGSWMYPLINSS